MIEALVVHNIPGRIRLKIDSKKGNKSFFDKVMDSLVGIKEIQKIEINPTTGSIIIYSNESSDSIIRLMKEQKLFHIVEKNISTRRIHGSFKGAYNEIDKKIKTLTAGELNLADAAFLGLLGMGIYQIQRGNFTAPAWYTAFWYAMNVFLKSTDKS
ncbi:MAG TPA: hypothetical protein HPP56_04940, partial [Nitrospirae bacterium]|nr:hypothetical protein [Nitrospirota bacterium]